MEDVIVKPIKFSGFKAQTKDDIVETLWFLKEPDPRSGVVVGIFDKVFEPMCIPVKLPE